MVRKRLGLAATCLVMTLLIGVGAVVWGLFEVPDFYQTAMTAEVDPTVRQQAARKLIQRTRQLVDEIQRSPSWSEEFTEQHINSWLAEELPANYSQWLPPGISDPRVKLADETIRIGFRYQGPDWNGVVTLQVKPWVTEPNRLAIQIQSVRAGLIPIPLDEVLRGLAREVEKDGWKVEWQEIDGQDVAIVNLSKGRADEPVLQDVRVLDGAFRVTGNRRPSSPEFQFDVPRIADRRAAD